MPWWVIMGTLSLLPCMTMAKETENVFGLRDIESILVQYDVLDPINDAPRCQVSKSLLSDIAIIFSFLCAQISSIFSPKRLNTSSVQVMSQYPVEYVKQLRNIVPCFTSEIGMNIVDVACRNIVSCGWIGGLMNCQNVKQLRNIVPCFLVLGGRRNNKMSMNKTRERMPIAVVLYMLLTTSEIGMNIVDVACRNIVSCGW
eukprot:CAMPEP_0204652008 /NCGR_PEP_ID=MMETSP0718-20130828/14306_1 /ASSEMBLY_ACC=CAM_ASM_000674 /TAXON_ID=230516 /ORGANISM="Chaetoceros curvisetus" /LENGTH=199 /DNA_ID=CAMNT_0051675913 /DNA_START=857 /DNA_END=1453 /DNA_ORIENTATION=+